MLIVGGAVLNDGRIIRVGYIPFEGTWCRESMRYRFGEEVGPMINDLLASGVNRIQCDALVAEFA